MRFGLESNGCVKQGIDAEMWEILCFYKEFMRTCGIFGFCYIKSCKSSMCASLRSHALCVSQQWDHAHVSTCVDSLLHCRNGFLYLTDVLAHAQASGIQLCDVRCWGHVHVWARANDLMEQHVCFSFFCNTMLIATPTITFSQPMMLPCQLLTPSTKQ